MVKDKKEQARALTPAEEKRLERFEAAAAQLAAQGYTRTDLTVGIVSANVFAAVLTLPVIGLGLWLFYLKNGFSGVRFSSIWMLPALIVLTVVHELVHGLGWSLYTPNRLRDMEFGFIKQYLTPYCACGAPLGRKEYIVGALAPLVIVGVIPAVLGILFGSFFWTMMGLIMILAAGGDMLIVKNILAYKTDAKDILYMDHPTQAGGVIFEK